MPLHNPTPRFRPVIRVFVSSTFSDLKAERNALQAQLFPKLELLCAQNGFQFQAIDLRWGVSSEAGLDHRTMRICLDELRRAQEISPEPNFLVLLGDRYGWRPLPEAISAMEFEALKKAATTDHTDDTDKHRSAVKDQKSESRSPSVIRKIREIRGQELDPLAVLNAWYRCDENFLLPEPPETDPDRIALNYLLQPRTRNLGDGTDYTRRKDDSTKDTQDWLDVQQVLWRLINTTFPADARWFDGVDWARHLAEVNDPQHPKRAIPQIARFQASATEQEIWCGALSATNAERHVIACFREISNRDDFSIAEVKDFFDQTDSGEFDEAEVARQTALKEAIRLRLGENKPVPIPFTRLKRENGKVLVDSSEADTQAFCDAVLARFRPIIERQIEDYWNKSAKGSTERAGRELEIERDEHRRFGRERGGSESFVGRKSELEAIRDYLRNDSRLPLVVHGSSGCGKTALMARALAEIQKEDGGMQKSGQTSQDSQPSTLNHQPIVRFIGTTLHSSDIRSLLGSLCQELRLRHPREGELPADTKALREELHEQFRAATPEQPLILFLDALDQLSDADGGRLLNWIPAGPLPGHVKLVVSCLSDRAEDDPSGQPCAELRRRQLPAENFINLDVLSEAEARTLLFDRWLHQAGRTVSPDQRERIEQRLASPVCRQPIYLKLLFEEARLWRPYDAVPGLGEDVSALLSKLFRRLGRRANHGLLLVKRVFGYLSASRHGLAENEILEILFLDKEYKKALDWATKRNRHELPASATRIPIAIWSRLRFDLAPYLTERAAPGANVLTFYHRQLAEWVQKHFVKAPEQSWQPHGRLVVYFSNRADPSQKGAFVDDHRALTELLFHLVSGGEGGRAQGLLGDLRYLDARCSAGSAVELLGDYRFLASIDNPEAKCLRAFILLHVQSLEKYSASFFSLVHHDGPALAKEQADKLLAKGLWKKAWLRTTRILLTCPAKAVERQAALAPLRRCEFERSCAVGFAGGPMLVFRLKQLGEITIFDLERLVELPQHVSIRRLRPLALFASDDARHLAIVYENGEAEVIKLHWSATGTLLSQSGAATFRCLLPEMDLPVMAWRGSELVYQEDEQNLACLALDTPVSAARHRQLPANACGELTGVAFVESRMVVSFRVGTSGAIVCFGPSGIEGVQHRQGAQALHVSHCGSLLVAAAWSDRRLCRYDTNRQLHSVDEVSVALPQIKRHRGRVKHMGRTYSLPHGKKTPKRKACTCNE